MDTKTSMKHNKEVNQSMIDINKIMNLINENMKISKKNMEINTIIMQKLSDINSEMTTYSEEIKILTNINEKMINNISINKSGDITEVKKNIHIGIYFKQILWAEDHTNICSKLNLDMKKVNSIKDTEDYKKKANNSKKYPDEKSKHILWGEEVYKHLVDKNMKKEIKDMLNAYKRQMDDKKKSSEELVKD